MLGQNSSIAIGSIHVNLASAHVLTSCQDQSLLAAFDDDKDWRQRSRPVVQSQAALPQLVKAMQHLGEADIMEDVEVPNHFRGVKVLQAKPETVSSKARKTMTFDAIYTYHLTLRCSCC